MLSQPDCRVLSIANHERNRHVEKCVRDRNSQRKVVAGMTSAHLHLLSVQHKIQDLSFEMTGHTSNIFEAFEQWQQEREALVEFYAIMQSQEEILDAIKKNWLVVRKTFWGIQSINAETARTPFQPAEIARLIEA